MKFIMHNQELLKINKLLVPQTLSRDRVLNAHQKIVKNSINDAWIQVWPNA